MRLVASVGLGVRSGASARWSFAVGCAVEQAPTRIVTRTEKYARRWARGLMRCDRGVARWEVAPYSQVIGATTYVYLTYCERVSARAANRA